MSIKLKNSLKRLVINLKNKNAIVSGGSSGIVKPMERSLFHFLIQDATYLFSQEI